MGFGKWLGRKIGGAIKWAGDTFGSETLSNIGESIQNACAEKISYEKSYEKDKANIHSTERLNEILVEFSEEYSKQATSIENRCIEIVEKFYDELIDVIEDVPETSYNKANLNKLKRGKRRIRESISGGIKEPLTKRMSLDDSECLKILKMDSGASKADAMSSFSNQVIAEALDNLSRKVRNSMNEQLEDIEEYLKNISEEQEKEFLNLKAQFEKMCLEDNIEAWEREKHCIKPLLVMDAVDVIENTFAEER